MPPAHRLTDCRYCTGLTNMSSQQTVFVNFLLWTVMGDVNTHCEQGQLIAVYPPRNVYIENIPIIVAQGDIAAPDLYCKDPHPTGPTNPACGSFNVFAYFGGGIMGGAAVG